jgi:peptide/nickel transport system substrate-binding protein
MKSNKKVQNKALSMKDALNEFKSLKVVESKEESRDWRNALWNYPVFIEKVFKKTIPFSLIFVFSILAILFAFFLQSKAFEAILRSNSFSNEQYTEGMVGAISSFNPLFASNNYVDKAIDSLIFQKFINIDINGKPTPGIAKSWTVSADSLTYTFVINDDLHWQDGTDMTIDDILFTFNTAIALDPNVSVGAALAGINITKVDSSTIQFVLTEANPTFYEAVSLYIVPKSALENVALQDMQGFQSFVSDPMGSGKYMIEKTEKNAVYLADNPYDSYNPKLKKLVFRIYPDFTSLETAMRVGDVDALGGWDSEAFSFMQEYSSFGVLTKVEDFRNRILFLNTRKDSLKDKDVRIALNDLLDVDTLLNDAHIQGEAMKGPYPERSWVFNNQISYYPYDAVKATELLNTAGYTKNTETGYFESKDNKILSFTITYLDNDINNRLINAIVKNMDKEGIVIKPNPQDYNEISQKTIVTRDFEILLYEIETLVDPDQYNLWHSSKVNDPYLNLSGYQYERVDILLEDARKTTNEATRKTKYFQFQKYLMADAPVVFLYHPTFVYYFNSRLTGIDMQNINFSYERFWNIEDWAWN